MKKRVSYFPKISKRDSISANFFTAEVKQIFCTLGKKLDLRHRLE